MTRRFHSIVAMLAIAANLAAQNIPKELRGKWVIERQLPASTISCWGDKEANGIIGTEIEYRADSFRWKNNIISHPGVKVAIVDAQQFHDDNSGHGAGSSQVSFRQLGITAPKVKQVTISHLPASITGATTEVPGDRVLFKDDDTIVFSVCNVYFEARRVRSPSGR